MTQNNSTAPEQANVTAPEQTEAIAPEQTDDAALEQTDPIAPEQAEAAAPEQADSIAPEQADETTPEQTEAIAPEQTEAAALERTDDTTPVQTSAQLRDLVIRYLVDFADTLRELELKNESEAVRKKIEEFSQGLFHVLFTGTFSAGKTTLLNGLQREDLLRVSIVPETAVITKIVNGENDDKVTVSFRDPDRPDERMPLEDFKREFHLDDKHSTKFHEVSYVTIKRKLSNDTVIYVDSPGISNTAEDDAVAFDFADNKADAVVFVLNATSLGKDGEREYIQRRFAGSNLRNVFFVVNWYNSVQPKDEEDFQQRLLNMLYSTFSDAEGNFDEELYNKRVFPVDALTSFYARTGTPKESRRGAKFLKETVPPEEDQYTGVPEFEAALTEFLESSDKDREAYLNYLLPLSIDYKATEDTIQFLADAMQLSQDELKKKIENMDATVTRLKDIVDHVQGAINWTLKGLLMSFRTNYDSFLTDLKNNWQSDWENEEVPFGVLDAGKLAVMKLKYWWKSRTGEEEAEDALLKDEKFLKLVAPINDSIRDYVQDKVKAMAEGIIADSQESFDTLAETIKRYNDEIVRIKNEDIDLQDIINKITALAGVDPSGFTSKFNVAQMVISLLFGNPDQAAENVVTGKSSLGKFLSDLLTQELLELLIHYIVYSFFGGFVVIYFIIRSVLAILRGEKARKNLGRKVVLQSGPAIVAELEKDETRGQIESQVNISLNEILKKGPNDVLNAFKDAMDQNLNLLKRLNEQYAENAGKSQSILQEKRALQRKLLASFNDISSLIQGKTYTSESVLAYAKPGANKL